MHLHKHVVEISYGKSQCWETKRKSLGIFCQTQSKISVVLILNLSKIFEDVNELRVWRQNEMIIQDCEHLQQITLFFAILFSGAK